jgi:hypothetical protein
MEMLHLPEGNTLICYAFHELAAQFSSATFVGMK